MRTSIRNIVSESLSEEAKLRRSAVEAELGVDLKGWEGNIFEGWKGRNIENIIGVVSVPVAVAGKIAYKLQDTSNKLQENREHYLPLATTEGALVASVARGCKAISRAGTASVVVKDVGMTRAPVFQVESISKGLELIEFAQSSIDELNVIGCSEERFLKLLKVDGFLEGRNVFLRLAFDTSEAMGMNMVTIASEKMVAFLEEKMKVVCVSLSGNACTDKKPTGINKILGRGREVWAEVSLSREIVQDVLKTTPEKMFEVYQRKTVMGSIVATSLGFNAHSANVVAALYLATGQDMAHVVHGSMATLSMELMDEGVYVSVHMADLPLGTVGGGTNSQSAQAGLKILGGLGGNKGDALRLAGAVGMGVLAGEVSLHAALSSKHLASAHASLGRGQKIKNS